MNPDPECDCCPPASCEACSPQTSLVRMIRAERPLKDELVCSTKNCNIYGGHDTNPVPLSEYQCRIKRNKTKTENKNSLGSPIGVAVSNVNFKTEGKPGDIIQARYATYLKGFACLHLNAETSWNSPLIDDIMKEGLMLYTASQQTEKAMESPADIYTPNEINILREFELSGFSFHIELMPPYKLNTSASTETGAKGDGVELTLEDIAAALKGFFRQHKYGLITVDSFYALIWRSNEAYFVFDACGRRVADFQSDKDKGVAMLVCLSSLENVRHLIVNLSSLQVTDSVVIREIKVVKVVTPGGNIVQQDYGTRTHQYQVVNDDYAYLRSGLHLTLNRRDLLRNRSALPVAVTAIVVSKIDHPATWNMKMVDKIICFGVNFCQACWVKCRDRELVDVNEFPTYFAMGQFQINIEIMAHKYKGTWRCVPGFKHSELAHVIKKAFDAGDQKLLMQINYQMYAIWKKHNFIYLLDPYRHRILGKQSESEVYEQMEKSATVRMFRSFDVFMNVFNHILLDSNRTSPFFIHTVKVKNIQTRYRLKEGSIRPIEDTKLDVNGEIISLNEHICFEEAENLCQKALGEISDYEDEDLKSDVVEIELRTSSSEAEDLLEEEEAGIGEVEEMEGLESSSSGEEGGGHKKKTATGRAGGKGGKGGSKDTGKGDKSKGGSKKGKKGQGTKDNEGGGKKRKKGENKGSDESSEDENEELPSKTKKSKKVKDDQKDEATNKKNKKKSKSKDQQEGEKDENEAKDSKLKQAKIKHDQEDGEGDKDLKNKNLKDSKEKDRNKDTKLKDTNLKDTKLKGEDDDGIDNKKASKDSKNLKGKYTDQKDRGKHETEKGDKKYKDELNDKDSGKDKDENVPKKYTNFNNPSPDNDRDKDKDKHKDLDKEGEDDNADPNLSKDQGKDKQQLDKLDKKDTKGFKATKGLLEAESKDILDILKTKTGPDKHRLSLSPDNEKKANQTDQPLEGKDKPDQSKTINHDLEPGTDQANGSDKENEFKEPNKNMEKELNKEKDIDNDKEMNEKHKHKEKLDQGDQPDSKERPLYDDLKQKGVKGKKDGAVRAQLYDDGTEADDENEDYFKKKQRYCSTPNPNRYPGHFKQPVDMAVVGSETGSYESICKLFQAGFKVADRLLTMTPWGNFVIFRCSGKTGLEEKNYFLFDGCTCNFDRFRHLDLSVGTAGLICFKHSHNVIEYIRHLRKSRRKDRKEQKYNVDDICRQYCNLRV